MDRDHHERESDGAAKRIKLQPPPDAAAADALAGSAQQRLDEELDTELAELMPRSSTRSAVKKGHECPYLDTILRQVRLAPARTACVGT